MEAHSKIMKLQASYYEGTAFKRLAFSQQLASMLGTLGNLGQL